VASVLKGIHLGWFMVFNVTYPLHKTKCIFRGSHGRNCVVVGFTATLSPVPITTKVVSSNPIHYKAYSIQDYVIKFGSDFATGHWFSPGTLFSSTNKTDCQYITEI
jgi:hypothetical protein